MKTSTQADWTKPRQTTRLEQAFGGHMDALLPPRDVIPEDYYYSRGTEARKWHRIQARWFCSGLPAETVFKCKPGVEQSVALGHLKCILGSFEPKHEHKAGAVAWLMSLWFDDIIVPEKP